MDPSIALTVFPAPARWTSQGAWKDWPWGEVLKRAAKPELWPGGSTLTGGEQRLPGWSFSRFRDNARVALRDDDMAASETALRVIDVHGLAVEYVDEPTADAERIKRWWGQFRYVAYTTAWHNSAMGDKPEGPRWRVLLPLARPVSLVAARKLGAWARHPRHNCGMVHSSTEDAWRYFFAPSMAPGHYDWAANEGQLLDPDRAIRELAVWQEEDRATRARGALADSLLADAVTAFLARMQDPERRPYLHWPGGTGSSVDVAPIPPGHLVPQHPPVVRWSRLGRLAGALWPGRLAVLAGESGRGRSAFALQVADQVASEGHPVLYVCVGMGLDEIVARLVTLHAAKGVDYGAVLQGMAPLDDLQRATRALARRCPGLYLWAPTAQHRTADDLVQRARAACQAHGMRPPLVVLDSVDGWAAGPDRERARCTIAVTLRDLVHVRAAGPDWPGAAVLAICHDPSSTERFRAVANGERLAQLGGGCQELQGWATLLMGLLADAPTVDDRPRRETVVVAKNRHGATGSVSVVFHPGSGVFTEISLDDEEVDEAS